MVPVIALVGRPNVGKSTLFNVLSRSRQALVADTPGLTRDRQYAQASYQGKPFILIDTGGIAENHDEEMDMLTANQVQLALQESDLILFLVDAKVGLTQADKHIANQLRSKFPGRVLCVVNKADRDEATVAASEFYELGFDPLVVIAAAQKRGINDLLEHIFNNSCILEKLIETDDEAVDGKNNKSIRIAIIGKPNVGKSTLVNRILGEDRVVVCDRPGTTRDSIEIDFVRDEREYTLIDTAGVRRRSRVHDKVEKFSIIKTLQAIENANIIITVVDATDVLSEQDMRILGWAVESGKGLVLAVNKWDGLDDDQKESIKVAIDRKLGFVSYARRYFISALHGSGVGKLYHAVDEAYAAANSNLTTSKLTKALDIAITQHQPPLVGGRRIKLRYAHLGGHNPLLIIIHGKQADSLPKSYQRYLAKFFREHFNLQGVPVQLFLKSDDNPYVKSAD